MIRIVEVGPRDGLQNERNPIPTDAKLRFIAGLVEAGLEHIEATSFVSPKWVPQLADAERLFVELRGRFLQEPPYFSALVPNERGLDRAAAAGVKRIALFTAASEAFTHRNLNMSVDESLATFARVASEFRKTVHDGWIRGYVSTAFECPYSGTVSPEAVARVVEVLNEQVGVDEISLGDTIGVAVPREVRALSSAIEKIVPKSKVAWHFHDTRGTAIANVAEALDLGYETFDSSAGGLGGCPYAPGAGGNLATEDLVYFLERNDMATWVDLRVLAEASLPILAALGRTPTARAQQAVLAGSRQT